LFDDLREDDLVDVLVIDTDLVQHPQPDKFGAIHARF